MVGCTSRIAIAHYGLWGTAIVSFFAAFFPLYQYLTEKWISSEDYSHAFLIIPVLVYMIWNKRSILSKHANEFSVLGLALMVLSIIIYLFALLTNVYTFISYSMFIVLVSTIIFIFGIKGIILLLTELLLILLIIPISDQFYIKITFPLQLKVSQISEMAVTLLNIPVFREGNVMHTATKSFEVVEACSGLRSIISLTTLSVIFGYFFLNRFILKFFLTMLSIPIAVLVNILRVTAMIVLFQSFGIDTTEGPLHTALGVVIFFFGLILLFVSQIVLEKWEKP